MTFKTWCDDMHFLVSHCTPSQTRILYFLLPTFLQVALYFFYIKDKDNIHYEIRKCTPSHYTQILVEYPPGTTPQDCSNGTNFNRTPGEYEGRSREPRDGTAPTELT